jgi:hypothetical protein
MVSTINRHWKLTLVVVAVASAFPTAQGMAQEKEARPVPRAELEKLHQLIKPQPGESRWMEIAWYPNVWEARQRAAKEGKPLFIWAGSGGAPAAGC